MIKLKRCISGLSTFLLLTFVVAMSAGAATAAVSISEPSDGATVRGEITVKVSGIPTGGYAIVKVDGGFMQATSQREFSLNTFDPLSFGTDANAKTDGEHKISVTGVDGSGKQTETATITINVANGTVDQEAPSVLLTHWVPTDRLEEKAQRYRVFAESNARSSADQASSGGATVGENGEMMGGGETAAGGGTTNSVSGLEWQYSALLRRTLRDVGMFDGAANIRVSVAEAFQRQREGQAGGTGEEGMDGEVVTAPQSSEKSEDGWNPTWTVAPENGSYFVKTITADGREINATRKKPTIAISDLLPSFPKEKVQPGSRWETSMTFLSDLSARKALTIKAPITLTSFEDVKLPSGEARHAAKLESRFRLSSEDSSDTALRMAAELVVRGGGAQSSGAESGASMDMGLPGAPEDMAGASTPADSGIITESQIKNAMKDIESASVRVSRVIWFDVENRRVLRLQDQINTSYELKQTAQQDQEGAEGPMDMGPGAGIFPGEEMGPQAAPTAPPEPVRVDYVMNVVTWYDDVPPAPTDKYNAGRGTAHSKDSVQEPSLSKVTGK